MRTTERELCRECGGNGVVKIPGGISVCPRCAQSCYEPAVARMTPDELRAAFEAWITAPPFERDIHRFPAEGAWPAQSCDYTSEVAWQAWQAATRQARATP